MHRSFPRGFVLIAGPDGAGKSTVADALMAVAEEAPIPVRRVHYRPGLLFSRRVQGGPVTDPHAGQPRGLPASAAKLALVFLDWVLGGIVLWLTSARRGVVIVERGWWDMLADPRRYRLHPRLLPVVRAFGNLAGRATLAVALAGDAEAIAARKKEISGAETRRQGEAWRALSRRASRHVLEIDSTDTSPEESAERIWRVLRRVCGTWRSLPFAAERIDMRAKGDGAALSVYRPLTVRARAGAVLHRPSLRTGLARRCLPPIPSVENLVADLGIRFDGLAAFRSSMPGRWVVGVGERGRFRAVVKIGRCDDAKLRREAEMLEALAHGHRSFAVPRLISTTHWQEQYFAVCMEATLPEGKHPDEVEVAAEIATELVRGLSEAGPLVHGDLAPWNVLPTATGPVVVDWESAETRRTPLYDLAHFVVRSGALLGRYDAAAALRLLTEPGGPGARHLQAVDADPQDAGRLLHDYLKSTQWTVRDPRDASFRRALLTLLDRPQRVMA